VIVPKELETIERENKSEAEGVAEKKSFFAKILSKRRRLRSPRFKCKWTVLIHKLSLTSLIFLTLNRLLRLQMRRNMEMLGDAKETTPQHPFPGNCH